MPTLTYANIGKLPIKPTLQDLFRYGEGGGAYEFPDFSSLFQDAAGTVPVTAIGQQVYRVNDISGRSNHLLQATANFRPRAARAPAGGVRNLLTYTEDFSNAAWVPSGATASTGSLTATNTTASVYQGAPSLKSGSPYRFSVKIKASTGSMAILRAVGYDASPAAWFNLAIGTIGAVDSGMSASISSIDANGFYNCSVEFSSASDVDGRVYIYVVDNNGSFSVTIGASLFIKKAMLAEASTDAAYQKVTAPWDVTEEGKRDCYCLYGDGIDDKMATAGNVLPVRNGLSAVGAFGHVSPVSSTTQGGLFGLSDLSTTYFTLRSRRQAAIRQAAVAVQNAAGAFATTSALGDAGFEFGAPIIIAGTQDGDVLSIETTNPDSSGTVAAALGGTVSSAVPIHLFPASNISPVRWYGGLIIDRPLTDLEREFAMEEFAYLSGVIE